MLHTELHSIHPFTPETRVSAIQMKPRVDPDEEVMNKLASEMENMIIEGNLKKDIGPLRSAWDNAVQKARTRSQSLSTLMMSTAMRKARNTSIQPEDGCERDESPGSAVDGEGRLPSPRPSPPPSIKRKGSSYMRARSISC
jgi:hypothetical protein